MSKRTEINERDILKHAEAILKSPRFKNSYKQQELFRYLLKKSITNETSTLKAYTIAVDLFDQNPEEANEVRIRIQVGRLRKMLEKYYQNGGQEDAIRIKIPKGNYTLEFGKKIENTVKTRNTRIVVFPFDALNVDDNLTHVVDAFGDELTAGFSNFFDLDLVCYLSATQMKMDQVSVSELREKFNVDYLISGRVDQIQNKISVQVKITDVDLEHQIWSKKYVSLLEENNIAELIEKIATQILANIGGDYGTLARHKWKSIYRNDPSLRQALQNIYEYRHFLQSPVPEQMEELGVKLESSLQDEHDYAEGWAVLSEIFCDNALAFTGSQRQQWFAKAQNALAKAKMLNISSPYVLYADTYVKLVSKNFSESIKAAKELLNSGTNNSFLIGSAGFFLSVCGEYDLGLQSISKTLELNPFYPSYFHHAYVLKSLNDGNFEEACVHAESFYAPHFFWSLMDQTACYALCGNISTAREKGEKLIELLPEIKDMTAEYLEVFVPQEKIQNLMLKGLRKAGI